jgi:hypothetical protein
MIYLTQIDGETRNMTQEEQTALDTWRALENEIQEKAVAEHATTRASALTKLAALGLTDEEITALVG